MKVSSKTEYALKTVIDLAVNYQAGICRIADIAERQGIPSKFLEQILLILKGGGVVVSKRGINGGYSLAKLPADISLGLIVRLTGDLISEFPSAVPSHSVDRALAEVWGDVNGYMSKKLDGISLRDICSRVKEISDSEMADYVI